MMSKTPKLLKLSACIMLSLGTIPYNAAHAADNEAKKDKAADIERIEVKGVRGSLNRSLGDKRLNTGIVDTISAEDLGKFPDNNISESLQRIPGVTIERFASSDDPKHYADEGTSVLVRGLDRVRSEVNGRDSFSANPYGGLSYEDFPAELLGAVEVVKNQTADLISGGIAGTVNLITRKPFDSDERLFSVSATANHADYREETTPSFSALFADNWDTDSGKFGVLVAASKSEFATRGDGFGLGNFHSRGPVDVFSYELLAYREVVNANAMPYSDNPEEQLPANFVTSDSISPKQHVDIQAAAQKWVDSSISKTANVPTDYPYEDFKDIYMYAYDKGLKGCTTFRFNPEAFQGVLVKEDDLENTTYQFTLDDGSTVEFKGNEEVEYDGETHTAANLFDALKEGYYGKF